MLLWAHNQIVGSCQECTQQTPLNHLFQDVDEVLCKSSVGQNNIVQTTSGAYRLRRDSQNKYIAELNLQFYARSLGEQESLWSYARRSDQKQKEFSEKMNGCFKMYGPYLKGPSGEQLEIRIVEDQEIPKKSIYIEKERVSVNQEAVRSQSVTIKEEFRSSVNNYAEFIDCPTILHEALHLLGLEDEYEEKFAGFNINKYSGNIEFAMDDAEYIGYDCRAIGPPNSVMSNQLDAINAVSDLVEVDNITCSCSLSEKACESKMTRHRKDMFTKKKCPPGFQSSIQKSYRPTDESLKRIHGYTEEDVQDLRRHIAENAKEDIAIGIDDNGETVFGIKGARRVVPAERKSLLMPAHFRMLTQPFCHKANKTYRECAEGAYMNSQVHKKCPDQAKKCQSDTNWLN